MDVVVVAPGSSGTAELAEHLREARIARGLSRRDLSIALDVSEAYVGMLERADRTPPLPTICAWAAALGLEVRQESDREGTARARFDVVIQGIGSKGQVYVEGKDRARQEHYEAAVARLGSHLAQRRADASPWRDWLALAGRSEGRTGSSLVRADSIPQALWDRGDSSGDQDLRGAIGLLLSFDDDRLRLAFGYLELLASGGSGPNTSDDRDGLTSPNSS